MTEIEETIKMYKQLCKEHTELYNKINSKFNISRLIDDDFFELKSLELEILRCESQLRDLGIDF